MKGVWAQLAGKDASNKNDVIKGVKWQLTGNRSAKYSAGGPGNWENPFSSREIFIKRCIVSLCRNELPIYFTGFFEIVI